MDTGRGFKWKLEIIFKIFKVNMVFESLSVLQIVIGIDIVFFRVIKWNIYVIVNDNCCKFYCKN